jgi:hypothetical protein
MRNFIFCTHPHILLGRSNLGGDGRDMWHAWERTAKCTRFWWGSPKERDHSEDLDGRMGSKWILLLGRLAGEGGGECGVDRAGGGYGPVAGCCKYGDEPAGCGATELGAVISSFFLSIWRWSFLAYFPKMKEGLSNHQPLCVYPTNNFWTAWSIFMKSGVEIMPFKGILMQ